MTSLIMIVVSSALVSNVVLSQFLVGFVENNLIFAMLLYTGFQVVTLDDPSDTAEVFVGIHMGSGP